MADGKPDQRLNHSTAGRRNYFAHARVYDPLIRQLVEQRHKTGMTQAELNDRIGCTDGLLAKWEATICYPTAYHLMLWAEALKMTVTIQPEGEEP